MNIWILMKNGWPVSALDTEWLAQVTLNTAEVNEPKEHWMILRLKIAETI
jgi:hypothetical protein